MLAVMAGLVFLLLVAIYSALAIGKGTDRRIKRFLKEDSSDGPMTVKFPDSVLHPKQSPVRGQARVSRQQ